MATYQIMYWHDIPAQIRVRTDGERISKPLPQRFLNAIDAAAMAANLTGSDEYSTGFHWGDATDIQIDDEEGSLEDIAEAVIALVEEQYPSIDWQQTAEALKPAAVEEPSPAAEETPPADDEETLSADDEETPSADDEGTPSADDD
ncbi:MAG: hypothetical protein GXP37_03860 [Chloroflexi bacterium]|nr:hypothetical protein [Chloroflexota bacterium]